MWLAVSNIMAGFQLKLSSWSSSVVGVSCSPLDSRHYLLSAAFTIARHTAANCHQLPAPLQGGGGKISTSKEISRCRGGRACPSVDLVGFALPRIVSMSDMMHTCCGEVKSKHWKRHKGTEGSVHITSSYTNLDEISISESRLSINFKISTKHQYLD